MLSVCVDIYAAALVAGVVIIENAAVYDNRLVVLDIVVDVQSAAVLAGAVGGKGAILYAGIFRLVPYSNAAAVVLGAVVLEHVVFEYERAPVDEYRSAVVLGVAAFYSAAGYLGVGVLNEHAAAVAVVAAVVGLAGVYPHAVQIHLGFLVGHDAAAVLA